MTFIIEVFDPATEGVAAATEHAVQFLTSNLMKAAAANWIVEHKADFACPALGVRMCWTGTQWRGEQASYKVVRVSHPSGRKTRISTGQSRAMAQAHCESPRSTGTRGSTEWMHVYYGEDDWANEDADVALKTAGRKADVKWPRYWVNGKPVRTIDLNGPHNDTDGDEGTPDE